MTHKVFWDDPYLTRLSAEVVEIAYDQVTLDRTIFFASSGGQERDRGTIGGREVLDAVPHGDSISYSLGSLHGLVEGAEVEIVIDAARRDRLRRLHMATEIVLELLTRAHPELVKVGAHMSADRGRIDFSSGSVITPWLPAIEGLANRMITSNLEIHRDFLAGSETRRYWEIADFARVPCGGTLPDRTGEIGPVALRRRNPGKGMERVEITLA